MYTVTIDREACDGVFACLVRDDRFVEASDGLAAIEVDDAHAIAGTFDDDRRDDAEQAAAACPLDAITVEDAGTDAPRSQPLGEAEP
ncbi:ferredoxin [Haloarcula laminariae]|uniref:ferredoxin n=1 Tax=Haloarcula laminariae TaxID=2961577 RepID=UPI0021C8AAA3|nr:MULTISPECIES: ferredoxin [Halomicroarcula]